GGTTPAVLLTGFGWYLEHVAHADISLDGNSLINLPAHLPLPRAPESRSANVTHRFALNDTNEGYAGAYLSWGTWQHRIDVLALRGINEVLVYEGQEAAYQTTFQHFGFSAQELRDWIPQRAHQPWWLLQNICCIGSPVSQRRIDAHARLGRQIADRLRQLGMTPVLPGYYGTVPPNFAARNAGARTVPQGDWDGLPRPDWLDPTNDYFAKVADAYYKAQSPLFGNSAMYKMDLLHEGGMAGDVDVTTASQAVQKALDAAHPGAIWAILGWEENPLPATLAAVDRSRMLVLDGISDQPDVIDRDKDFRGTPYAFGTIWNYGGHTNIGAGLANWNRKFHAWRHAAATSLDGIALMPEAIDNNPAAVAFFTAMAWEDAAVDLHSWFADYATARYGGADPHAQAAWLILADTVYSWPSDVDTRQPLGLFSAQPSLTAVAAAMPYEPALLNKALNELLKVNPRLRNNSAYRYDLVDVARQVMANRSRTLLPAINAAYQASDLAKFQRLTGRWLRHLALI
ncbi:MAG: alpha-N-acetylglucosaminidase TIM-barrel domain-containing protein, partial [Nevskiales bacterium]